MHKRNTLTDTIQLSTVAESFHNRLVHLTPGDTDSVEDSADTRRVKPQ